MKQAMIAFEQAWKADTQHRSAAYNLTLAQNDVNPEDAFRTATELTNIHPLYANGWSALGNACLKMKDWTCSETAFQKAHQLEPDHDTHLINLGSTHYLQGHWEQSIEYWSKALEFSPDNDYVLKGLQAAREQAR